MPDIDRIVRDAIIFGRLNPEATEQQIQDFLDTKAVEQAVPTLRTALKHLLRGDYVPWHVVCLSALLYDRGNPPAESDLSRFIRSHPTSI